MRRYIVLLVFIIVGMVSLACGGTTQTNAPIIVLPSATQGREASATVAILTNTVIPTSIQAVIIATKVPATATATEIPASSTPRLPELEILSSQNYTDAGWFHIVGEVRNNSSVPMEYVKIVATLYDDSGKITGTDFTYTELDVIPPGGKSPFETGTEQYEGTTNYKLQVQGHEGVLGKQDLVVYGDSSYEEYGWLHIRGEVQNTGTVPVEFVKIIATLYDVEGNVIGMDFTYSELDIIPANGSSPFETGTEHYPKFDHYEIQVQGKDAE